jgi:hypothetical protein
MREFVAARLSNAESPQSSPALWAAVSPRCTVSATGVRDSASGPARWSIRCSIHVKTSIRSAVNRPTRSHKGFAPRCQSSAATSTIVLSFAPMTRMHGNASRGSAASQASTTPSSRSDFATPFARGGEHRLYNIALRCRAHNALAAEEDFGRHFVALARESTRHEAWAAQEAEPCAPPLLRADQSGGRAQRNPTPDPGSAWPERM